MKLTDEQGCIVQSVLDGSDIAVNAAPGTGKTTVSRFVSDSLAQNMPEKKILYLAFNESTAASARKTFNENTDVSTIHALAHRRVPHLVKGKKIADLSPHEIIAFLNIKSKFYGSPSNISYLVGKTLANFCNSSDKRIKQDHIPELNFLTREKEKVAKTQIGRMTANLFNGIVTEDKLNMPHGVYLKAWEMMKPKLKYDLIILDEAQDTNPVSWSIISSQDSQKLLVGDKFQQINEWRGGMNVLGMLDGAKQLNMTQSFRFGEDIASVANRLLKYHFNSDFKVVGSQDIKSTLGKSNTNADLCLYRTNNVMIGDAISDLHSGRRVMINGNFNEFVDLIKNAYLLKEGRKARGELGFFKSWSDAVNFSEQQAGNYLKRIFKMVKENPHSRLLSDLDKIREVGYGDADVIYSTVHRAKGMQANHVRMGTDFKGPGDKGYERSESNLLYVAATRAREHLDETGVRDKILAVPAVEKTVEVEKNEETISSPSL